MNWEQFKETEFAVKCTSGKDKFFSDCAEHGIYNFMGERAMLRDYFVCRLCYKDQFSEGRYELMSCDEWQIKENGLFGKYGLGVLIMKTLCDKCLHKEICAIRDTHDEGNELAMTFCDNFKMEALIEMKMICEIDSLCIDTFGNFNHKKFIELKAKHLNKCEGKR